MTPPQVELDTWITALLALLSGGGAKFVWDTYKDYRNLPSRARRQAADIDTSILTVARARDELEADNVRIRQTLAEERKQWSEERERYQTDRLSWYEERKSLHEEIETLRERIRTQRDENAARYEKLLADVARLSSLTNEAPAQ